MALYDTKEKEDRVFIPKEEYKMLLDRSTRVEVVLLQMEADKYMSIEEVKRILAPYSFMPKETKDDLEDAFGYTE